MSTIAPYPVRVEARLDPGLSRWLWLVKWLLAIPHYVVLFFLWAAFAVLSIGAFFSIAFTARYPKALFTFNVGVLRWTWRVAYYTYGTLGTDRYPPFTIADVPDYPARLDVAYPERLSRGLVWVKWWLLAIPHYLIVAFLVGWLWEADRTQWFGSGGLIGVLVVIAAVALAFTGRYPQALFDFVLGLNRWVIRTAAYAGLMTDEYPPFRLDMGGGEPAGTLTVPEPPVPTEPATGRRAGWTGGRITAVVIGSILALGSLGLLATGGVALWADQTQRDSAGFIVSGEERFATPTYALVSEEIRIDVGGARVVGSLLGDVRLRVTPTDPTREIFVGIARTESVESYLGDVERAVFDSFTGESDVRVRGGGSPAEPPGEQGFWAASASGPGTQSVEWEVRDGSWTVVAMNADADRGVAVFGAAGAKLPALPWIGGGLLVAGVLLAAAGILLIVIPTVRAGHAPTLP